jgi:nicotinamidase-related amidase
VIYSAGLDTPPGAVYSGRWADKNRRRHEDTTKAKAGGNEIIEPIAPQDGDIVIRKLKPSVFHGTPLLDYLVELQVDTLVCCGVATSGCVRSTVLDAFSHNFRVAVVEEATFDRIDASHALALFDIHCKYGDVVSLDDATSYLSTRGSA